MPLNLEGIQAMNFQRFGIAYLSALVLCVAICNATAHRTNERWRCTHDDENIDKGEVSSEHVYCRMILLYRTKSRESSLPLADDVQSTTPVEIGERRRRRTDGRISSLSHAHRIRYISGNQVSAFFVSCKPPKRDDWFP